MIEGGELESHFFGVTKKSCMSCDNSETVTLRLTGDKCTEITTKVVVEDVVSSVQLIWRADRHSSEGLARRIRSR